MTLLRDRSMASICTVSKSGLRARSYSPGRETSASRCSSTALASAISSTHWSRTSLGCPSCASPADSQRASPLTICFASFFFFGGLSIHLSQALLAHLFSYNITWGATKKEVERSNFWLEVPKILKRFWIALVISLACCAVMIILSTSLVPIGWRIFGYDWAVIVPLA